MGDLTRTFSMAIIVISVVGLVARAPRAHSARDAARLFFGRTSPIAAHEGESQQEAQSTEPEVSQFPESLLSIFHEGD